MINKFYKDIPSYQDICTKMNFESADEDLLELVNLANRFNERIEALNNQFKEVLEWINTEYEIVKKKWEDRKTGYDEEIKLSLKDVEGIHDKSSNEIVADYVNVLRKVQQAEPIHSRLELRKEKIVQLESERKTLIEKCRKCWDEYALSINKQLKALNKKKLNNSVRLSVKFRQQKKLLLQRLKEIDGIGDKSILGIENYDELDVFTFANDVREGVEHLKNKYALSQTNAEKIVKDLTKEHLREIESMRLPDLYIIELYVNGQYKRMENLSKGQQCTAILNILLLDNKDPLIVDQPEDNLDNAFVAENLISCIRENKIKRQYIFATHNANIPVFGDAELIVAMEEVDGKGKIAECGIGSIDVQDVKKKVVDILEGGEAAFKMREAKYGL